MKRTITVLLLALSLGMLAGSAALAAPHGQAGKSNTAHLYLYEKNPADWSIVDDGAWGKMNYRLAVPQFRFVFNGHGLLPGTDYTLIYYPDPWPGTGAQCLGSGVVNEDGNVHIADRVELGTDLPATGDANAGAKIWLVLTADVECSVSLVGWNPTAYLFEHELITYEDTNAP